jgi:hypothetical protein
MKALKCGQDQYLVTATKFGPSKAGRTALGISGSKVVEKNYWP